VTLDRRPGTSRSSGGWFSVSSGRVESRRQIRKAARQVFDSLARCSARFQLTCMGNACAPQATASPRMFLACIASPISLDLNVSPRRARNLPRARARTRPQKHLRICNARVPAQNIACQHSARCARLSAPLAEFAWATLTRAKSAVDGDIPLLMVINPSVPGPTEEDPKGS